MKKIVFIESPSTGSGLDAIVAAHTLNLEVYVLAKNSSKYDFSNLSFEVKVITINTDSLVRMFSYIKTLDDVVCVTSAYEFYTHPAALLSHQLGLKGPDPEAVRTCRSKELTRRTLKARANSLSVNYCVLNNLEDIELAASKLGFPMVLKVSSQAGGAGVEIVSDLAAALSIGRALLELDEVDGRPLEGRVIAEEYLHGEEFSVEVIDGTTVAITKKFVDPEFPCMEIGHMTPAPICVESRSLIAATAEEALMAVNLIIGPAHVEIMLTTNGPKIVEINARAAGDYVPRLVTLATGYPFSECYISSLCNMPPPKMGYSRALLHDFV